MTDRWKIEDIAAVCDKSVRYVRETVVKIPSFPAPIVNTPRGKVWAADDVRQWLGSPKAAQRSAPGVRGSTYSSTVGGLCDQAA